MKTNSDSETEVRCTESQKPAGGRRPILIATKALLRRGEDTSLIFSQDYKLVRSLPVAIWLESSLQAAYSMRLSARCQQGIGEFPLWGPVFGLQKMKSPINRSHSEKQKRLLFALSTFER